MRLLSTEVISFLHTLAVITDRGALFGAEEQQIPLGGGAGRG